MEIIKIIMASLICLTLLTLLWQAKGSLLKSSRRYHFDENLSVTVTVSGSAPKLENTVSRLVWLRENGDLPAHILLVDDGMDSDTAKIARLLADAERDIYLCTPDQLEFFILRSCNDGDFL